MQAEPGCGNETPITDLSAPPPIGSGPSPARTGLLADRQFLQVRFGGTGEQGVILVGVVLAMAATRDHRYVVQTQTYGLGARGGYGHSDVIISDTPIDYPEFQSADVLVTLSQDAADGYADLLTPDEHSYLRFGGSHRRRPRPRAPVSAYRSPGWPAKRSVSVGDGTQRAHARRGGGHHRGGLGGVARRWRYGHGAAGRVKRRTAESLGPGACAGPR